MIIRGVRKRNQNSRQRKERELSETGRAGTCHGKVGRAINLFHVMMERRDVSRDTLATIIVGHETLVAHAGKMNRLKWNAVQTRQRFDDSLIDSAGALTSAHDKHSRQIVMQSKFCACNMSIHSLQLGANGRAGDFGARCWEKGRAFLEAEQNSANDSRGQAIRFSRNGI